MYIIYILNYVCVYNYFTKAYHNCLFLKHILLLLVVFVVFLLVFHT